MIDGQPAEVQINLPEMLEAKEQAHPLYERVQEIDRKADRENRDRTPEEQEEITRLYAEQQAIYEGAWDSAMSRMKSSRDNGPENEPGLSALTADRKSASDRMPLSLSNGSPQLVNLPDPLLRKNDASMNRPDSALNKATGTPQSYSINNASSGRPASVGMDGASATFPASAMSDTSGESVSQQADEQHAMFPPESGTLGIPRTQMPQIKGEHRQGFLRFLAERGIESRSGQIDAAELKPTQADYSPEAVDRFARTGPIGQRSVLVSSDGYVLDGHHQWLAYREQGEPVPVVRLNASIAELLDAAHAYPKTQRPEGANGLSEAVAPAPGTANHHPQAQAPQGVQPESSVKHSEVGQSGGGQSLHPSQPRPGHARGAPGLPVGAGAPRMGAQEGAREDAAEAQSDAKHTQRTQSHGPSQRHESGIQQGLRSSRTDQSEQLEQRINAELRRTGDDGAGSFRVQTVSQDELRDELRRALGAFRAATGTEVHIFRNLTPEVFDFNGVNFRDGVVHISEDSQYPLTLTAAHEWLHNLRRTNPELYWELANEVARQGDLLGYQKRLKREGETRWRNMDLVEEELTAAAVSDALTDPEFLQRLAERKRGLFRRVARAFLDFLSTLTQGWRDQGSNQYLQDVEAFRDKLAEVLDAFDNNSKSVAWPSQIRAMFQRVWHGTPHRGIEKTGFKLNAIGTGEGAQAYGWGIYFASQKEVAESYRAATGEGQGQLYQVEIPEDSDLLDFDAPLPKQPPKVREAIERIIAGAPKHMRWIVDGIDADTDGNHMYGALGSLAHEMRFEEDPDGDGFPGGDSQAASELLREYGIPGLRYLDGDSRAAGDGSHNYVIWDEALLTPEAAKIEAMYSRSAMKNKDANIRRGREALAKAVREKTSVHRAMYRNGLGWVDFVWGDEGRVKPSGRTAGAMGIAHIFEARKRKDGMSDGQVARLLDRIVTAIAKGQEVRRDSVEGAETVVVASDGVEAVLTRRRGSNAWLLSGWEVHEKPSRAGRAGSVAPSATTSKPTTAQLRRGEGTPSIPQDSGQDNGPMFSRKASFYSALERSVAELPMKAGDAAAWRQQIAGLVAKGQVKQDEVFWSGVQDWLDAQDGKIAREAVQAYLQENHVRLGEPSARWTYIDSSGERRPFDSEEEARQSYERELEWVEDEAAFVHESDDRLSLRTVWNDDEAYFDKEEGEQWVNEEDDDDVIDSPEENFHYRYGSAEEDGDTLKIYDEDGDLRGVYVRQKKEVWNGYRNGSLEWEGIESREEALEILEEEVEKIKESLRDEMREPESSSLTATSQFDFSDYSFADKGGNYREVLITASGNQVGNYKSSHWKPKNVIAHIRLTDFDDGKTLFVEELQSDWAQDARAGKTKAKAPFVDSTGKWLDLALKRVLIEAVNGGYARVALIDGQQSVDRYSLDKQIARMDYADGELVAHRKDGSNPIRHKVDENGLASVVGKETAERLLAAEPQNGVRTIEGDDLKMGGHGMRAFYDSIVPRALEKLLKKADKRIRLQAVEQEETGQAQLSFEVTDELSEKIADGAPMFSRKSDADDSQNDMYLGHNISPEGLRHALELGGLAAPSLAVARTSNGGLDNFGSITLLADKDLIGRSDAPLFDTDVYSPRQPRGEEKLNDKKWRAFEQELSALPDVWHVPDRYSVARDGASELARNARVQLLFLQEQGIEVKVPKKKLDTATRRMVALAQKHDLRSSYAMQDSPEFAKAARAWGEYQIRQEGPDARADYLDESGELKRIEMRGLARAVEHYIRTDGVDMDAMRETVRKKLRSKALSSRFDSWVRKRLSSISDGKVINMGARPKPYTLENVVDAMTRTIRGGEQFNYGAGNIRARLAGRIKSVQGAQKRRGKIISGQEFEKLREESNDRMAQLLEKLRPYYRFDAGSFGYYNDATTALAGGEKGLREAFNLDAEGRKLVEDFKQYLRELPTSYFEMKVQRAMQLGEFKAAVVPKGTDKGLIGALRERGLQVATYDPKQSGARAAAIEKLGKRHDVMFSRKSGGPTPEVRAEAERQFKAAERAYGGKKAYEKAKAAGKTKLTYGQWVQVRTPNFKKWFGDWEAVRARDALQKMEAIPIAPDQVLQTGAIALARQRAKALYAGLDSAITADGRQVRFPMSRFKETMQHAADRRVLLVIPKLPELIGKATPLWVDVSTKTDQPNVRAFRHYGVKAAFPDGEAFVRIVLREDNDGHVYYDNDATTVEALDKQKAPADNRQPGRKPKPGEDAEGLSSNRIAQWWNSVNPAAVSKVIDPDTGEPLVVYHGTNAGFSVFDGGRSNSKSNTGVPEGVFFFTDNHEFASSYTVGYQGDFTTSYLNGGNVMPVFLNIRKPMKVNAKGENWSDIVHKGEWYTTNELADIAKQESKKDGLIVSRVRDKGRGNVEAKHATTFAAFRPNQIKSATANIGTFDEGFDEIMFSRKREEAETLSERLLDKVMDEVLPNMGRAGEFIAGQANDGFIRDWRDEFIDLQRAEEDTARKLGMKREDLPDHLQARRQENLRHGAYQDRLERAEQKFFEPVAELLGEAGLDRNDFADYLWWRHAGERDAYLRQKDNTNPGPSDLAGIDPKKAQANIDALPKSTRQAFERAAAHIDALRQYTLDVLVNSGQIRPEVRDALLARWKHYVPLRGLPHGKDDPILSSYTGGGAGKGLSVARNALGKKALGRKSKPSDILEQMHLDLERALIGAEKQKVLKRIIGLIQANPDIGTIDPVKTEKREVNGVIEYVMTKGDHKTQLLYLHQGKPVKIEIKNQHLARALLAMNEPISEALRFAGKILRWLSAVKTAYSPYFMLINPFRDMEFAALGIGAEHGRKALWKAAKFYPRTFAALRRDAKGEPLDKDIDRYAREFGMMGGKTGYTYVNDINEMRGKLDRMFRVKRKGLSPVKAWALLNDFTEAANSYAENAARLAVYAAMREAGVSPEKAAKYAKDITVNFNVKGRLGKHMNMAYMFFNAAVQGTARVVNLARNRNFRIAMLGLVATSYAVSLAQMLAMGDDDDDESLYLKKLRDSDRLRSMPISLGDEEWFSIPVPYGPNFFNYVGSKLAEVTYEQMRGRSVDYGEVAGEIISAGAQSFSPLGLDGGPTDLLPEVVRVPINALINRDDRGRPINYAAHFEGESHVPKHLMGNAETGAGFKAFARLLNNWSGGSDYEPGAVNMTPEQIRYVAENGLGGLYRLGTETYELAEKIFTDDAIAPQDVPLSNVFVRSRSIERQQAEPFYANSAKTKALRWQYGRAVERDDKAEIERLTSEHPWLRGSNLPGNSRGGRMMQAHTPVGQLREAESRIRRLRNERESAYLRVGRYEGITATESRAKIREIDSQIAEAQRRFNTQFNKAERMASGGR